MSDHPATGVRPPGRGGCPHCGYAMTPELDRVCPRCKKAPDEAPAPAAPPSRSAPLPPTPFPPIAPGPPQPVSPTAAAPVAAERPAGTRASRAGQIPPWRVIGGIICGLMVIAMSGVWFRDLTSPHARAASLYRSGMSQVKGKDFVGARASFTKALKLEECMSEASLCGGMSCIEFWSEEEAKAAFERLLEQARQGDTKALDNCDAWLRDCIKRCDKDPKRRPVDRSLRSTKRIKSTAQALLGATALLRGAAAAQAQQEQDMRAWLDVSGKLVQAAETTDPDNPWIKPIRQEYDTAQAIVKSAPTPSAASSPPSALSPSGPYATPPLNFPNAEQFMPGSQIQAPTYTPPQLPPNPLAPTHPLAPSTPGYQEPAQPQTSANTRSQAATPGATPSQLPPSSAAPTQPAAPYGTPGQAQPTSPSRVPYSPQPAYQR